MIDYRDWLRLLPKVELHCHLVATIRPATLVELAAARGVTLPTTDPAELFAYDNIVDFLVVFDAAARTIQRPEDFERVAYEGVADAVAAGNLRYGEYFVNAGAVPGLSYVEVVDAVIAGLRRAETEFDTGFGVIAAIDRRHGPDEAVALVRAMIDDPRPEVVGLGQDYLTPDDTESPELFVEAYALAGRHGINRTAHVAEIPGSSAEAVTIAMRDLGCTRLDHGYHVMDDPAVVAAARAAGVAFTCTPHSTRVLSGWELGPEHPIAAMVRAGLEVTLSTDDPTMFRTDIGAEYAVALAGMGFGPDVARRIALAGVAASWAPPHVKARMRAQFTAQIRALDALLDPASVPAPPAAPPA